MIIAAHTSEEYAAAEKLFREYAAWLDIDLCFQSFDEELQHLEEMYALPDGGIFLMKEDDLFIGCIAVRRKDAETAELKRMYIQPAYRRSGSGNILLQKALSLAKELGYKRIRLDTLATMIPAINLYKRSGFYETEPYYFNPEKNAVFFEKLL